MTNKHSDMKLLCSKIGSSSNKHRPSAVVLFQIYNCSRLQTYSQNCYQIKTHREHPFNCLWMNTIRPPTTKHLVNSFGKLCLLQRREQTAMHKEEKTRKPNGTKIHVIQNPYHAFLISSLPLKIVRQPS
jgi:hypothetical protein